ncbi:hypothetical protein ABN028_07685 [Actinopolymorpha sp. B17G11]|uniref:hypothetical protein n=1 Tax=Actinopolymorpha sp. B17G11 TaxID=3160861 RepID=UPI0032E45636
MKVALIAGAVAVALFVLDRGLLWMERRRWIYYRRTKSSGGMSLEISQLFDPTARLVKREMEQETVRKVVRPSGDPPFDVDLDAHVVRVRRQPRRSAPD